ncbi:MAG: LamG domain-containing protein [Gammaproteobacteria bacterium]|nr:LamG domain-containing protein [Gammaproteobacteria bacterium]MDH3415193.1 LamG domain-containing protein [Gammaproteobacteria bacterium]
MIKATGIAMRTTPIDKSRLGSLKAGLLAVIAGVMLAACGGGAQTADTPLPNGTGNTNNNPYTGPIAETEDVLKFQQEFWSNAKTTDRCGSCHNETAGILPMFVRNDDINLAYAAALTKVDVDQPSASEIVSQVGSGHNCWVLDDGVCATILTTWIENWVGDAVGGGRQIVLTAPEPRDPSESKNFPDDGTIVGTNGTSFADTVYPLLDEYCSGCHSSAEGQNPFFADTDIAAAYESAKPKMNLDTPANSRFVQKLRVEQHNCWDSCANNSQEMEDAILLFASGIDPTLVDESLVISKAMRLTDGTIASGGNRYEDAQIALWEFKTGSGLVAYDTSGVDPAIDLNLSQAVTWYGGWGITTNGGRAQGLTNTSTKLSDIIQESGEFSIEAWVIPANVTQEDASIITYSAGSMDRNFTVRQNLYDYNYLLRTSETSLEAVTELLSTPADDEVLQATLQHVVATYHPIDGRRIYVNGDLVSPVDPVPGGTLIDWQNNFAFILGSDASGDNAWEGTIRLAALHRRALTQEQVTQNFDVGVGEKFFLLFDISHQVKSIPETDPSDQSSYILFEVAQYDSYSYLFDKPHFITLDGSAPEGIRIKGLRVAMNGLEAPVGQTYATMDDLLSAQEFVELGQPLSSLGAVLPLEKGPEDDDFFLTFDILSNESFSRPNDPTLTINPVDLENKSQIGLRTFDEINATYSEVLGIDWTDFSNVNDTYLELRQSLPAVEDIDTFLSSHQVAIAQLAIAYCDALVNVDGNPNPIRGQMFPGFNFDAAPTTAFSATNRDLFVVPLIDYVMGTGLTSQPAYADVYSELASFSAAGGRPHNLVQRLIDGGSSTRAISKGVCAAMLGSAATLVQ